MEPTAAPVEPGRLRRWWRLLLWHLTNGDRWLAAALLAIFAYYCATPGIFQGKASGDGLFGFFYLPGLIYGHTFDMAAPAGPWWIGVLGREATGHVGNPCPIGPVFLWLPTYLLGLGLKAVAGLIVTLPVEKLPGQTQFDYWMAALGSLVAGFHGMAMMHRFLERRLGRGGARFGVLTAVLATPLVFYFVTQPLYQHACAFWAVTLLVERWDAWRGDGKSDIPLRRWALLGALGGVAMLMRLQEAVWLLLPGLDVLAGMARSWRQPRALGRWLLGGAVMAVATFAVFAPQILLWRYFYGAFRPPQPPGHMLWSNPALLATLFSMRAGLVSWSPVLYLFLPGLWLARRSLGPVAWRLALMFAIVLWVNAAAWDHWGSWSFGARRFTDATIVFAAGLGGLWTWLAARREAVARWGKRALVAVGVFTVAYNALLMELVRQRRVNSSGAAAWPASYWVRKAGGPEVLARAFDRVGYPFVQPLGWIYALVHRAPVAAFEGIMGNYLVERDWKVHESVQVRGFSFHDDTSYVVEGMARPPFRGWPPGTLVPAGPRLRILVPLLAREPLRLRLLGRFEGKEAQVKVTWNGRPVPATAKAGEVKIELPADAIRTRAWTNELTYEGLAPGTRLRSLDIESYTKWWAR